MGEAAEASGPSFCTASLQPWLFQEPRWRCIRYAPRADFSATTEALVDGKSYSSGFLRYCLECVVLCVSFPAFVISASRHAQWCSLHSMGI